MKIYLTPTDLQGRVLGDVVICDSYVERDLTLARFKALGYPGVQQTRGDIVCDFCSHPEVKWCYGISPGQIIGIDPIEGDTHIDRDGLWGACAQCAVFISAGDWDAMTKRSVLSALRLAGVTDPAPWEMVILAGSVQSVHNHFRATWEKDGTPAPTPVVSDAEFLANAGIEHPEG